MRASFFCALCKAPTNDIIGYVFSTKRRKVRSKE